MKEQKDIFNRIKDNQHKLDERPSPALWDRLEEQLDQAEEQPLAIRTQLYRRLSIAAAVIALVGMIALVNNLMQQKTGQNTAMAQMTEAPKQWEDLNGTADSKTEAWYRYAASQHRLNKRPSIQEGTANKKLVAQNVGSQKIYYADHRDSNIHSTSEQFAVSSSIANATSVTSDALMANGAAAPQDEAKEAGAGSIDVAENSVMPTSSTEIVATTTNTEKISDEVELYAEENSADQAVGYANPSARKKMANPMAKSKRADSAREAKRSYAKDQQGVQQFSWLLGQWENGNGVKKSTESWEMINEFTLAGKGELSVNGQTTFSEAMTIQKVNQDLYYVMVLDESGKTVRYKLKSIQQNEAVFENTIIDFPKQVILRQIDSGNYSTILQNSAPVQIEKEQQVYLNYRNVIRKKQVERTMKRADKK